VVVRKVYTALLVGHTLIDPVIPTDDTECTELSSSTTELTGLSTLQVRLTHSPCRIMVWLTLKLTLGTGIDTGIGVGMVESFDTYCGAFDDTPSRGCGAGCGVCVGSAVGTDVGGGGNSGNGLES